MTPKPISAAEFAERRARLMAQLEPSAAVLIASARMMPRNSDVDYAFRQNSDFFYFTGFDEPDALALLVNSEQGLKYHLFCLPRDPQMEIWHGYRTGPQAVVEQYGADEGYSNERLDELLPELLDGCSEVLYRMTDNWLAERLSGWLDSMRQRRRQGVMVPQRIGELSLYSDEMRLIKSAAEIELMRHAAEISARAHCRAMRECHEGLMEYQLEAEICHQFIREGSRQAAYPSIVGAGANGCILHYIENSKALENGQLVLIDAGAEYQYYAGDITRTFPVSGQFNDEQRALYQLVLDAQLACIEMVKPGTPWEDIHQRAVAIISQGLIDLGLLEGELDEVIEQGSYRAFFMHKLGHWLGMDVHDVGDYKLDGQWRELAPGMVMTVEPGIYVAVDNFDVEPRWRGIGIRIEDDVLVTESGCEILTAGVPKSIAEVEALVGTGRDQ